MTVSISVVQTFVEGFMYFLPSKKDDKKVVKCVN